VLWVWEAAPCRGNVNRDRSEALIGEGALSDHTRSVAGSHLPAAD